MSRANKVRMVADNLFKIPISCLKLNEFLKTSASGTIDIPFNGINFKDGVHLVVSLSESDPYLYFYYAILQPTGEYKNFEYRVDLEATRCHYGGTRFWYKCPTEILGCGRRAAVLYLVGNYLCCRNCFNLTYKTRNKRGFNEFSDKHIALINDARDPRWKSYRGKSTRRFKRAQKMKAKFDKYIDILKRKNIKAKERRERQEKSFQKEMRLMEKTKNVG